MRADARLALVVAAAGAAAAMALAAPTLPVPVRAVGAGALALALPGAAIVAALMPRVRWRRSERLALALGGSLTVAIAAAFVLHASPTGLTASAWAGLLGGVAVVGGIVGCLRALRAPASGVPPAQLVPDGGAVVSAVDRSAALSPWAAAMLVASGLLVMVALVMARSGVALGPEPRFAELWLLPAEGDRAVRVAGSLRAADRRREGAHRRAREEHRDPAGMSGPMKKEPIIRPMP